MPRTTSTLAATQRRRRKHEERIAAQDNPLAALAWTWAWVYAEAKRMPHLLHEITEKVHAIGVDLSERGEK